MAQLKFCFHSGQSEAEGWGGQVQAGTRDGVWKEDFVLCFPLSQWGAGCVLITREVVWGRKQERLVGVGVYGETWSLVTDFRRTPALNCFKKSPMGSAAVQDLIKSLFISWVIKFTLNYSFQFDSFPEMIIILKANVILLDWVIAEVMHVSVPG